MTTYKVKNTNLMHDGRVYKIGEEIELDDKSAKKLAHVLVKISQRASAETKTVKTEKTVTVKTTKTAKTAAAKKETTAAEEETAADVQSTETDKGENE